MSNKIREHLLSLILVFTWLLGGCAPGSPAINPGDVLNLQPTTTMVQTYSALQGLNPFARALVSPDKTTFFLQWPGPGLRTWSAVCINVSCPTWMRGFRMFSGEQGMVMLDQDMSALVNAALAAGWQWIKPIAIVGEKINPTILIFPLVPGMIPAEVQG
jgi:hypothetical protein